MFPQTITIYRHSVENGVDVISRQVIRGVYWYGGTSVSESGKGVTEESNTTVITSPETASQYAKGGWSIKPKDRILKGENPETESLKEIPNALTVLKVEENICGSAVDNITVTAK